MERKSLLTNRKFMAKLIPSKTVRQSIGGWQPTDFELAALIRHMKAALRTKCYYFEYLLENSDDERLIAQIHEFFRISGGIVYAFQQLEPGHIYVLRQRNIDIVECFSSYEDAFAFGLSQGRRFELRKCPLETIKQERPSFAIDCDFVQYGPDNRNPNLRPRIWYDKDGDIMDWYQPLDCYPGLTVEEAVKRRFDLANFENAYVEVSNPFSGGISLQRSHPLWSTAS